MQCKTFPYNAETVDAYNSNPAIRLFGNRLFIDQSPAEFLIEFLLITNSKKRFGSQSPFTTVFPCRETLESAGKEKLHYAPKARLNLKLFSFLGASRLDSRHITHRSHYQKLVEILISKINITNSGNKQEVVSALQNLFLGFQGAGSGRTWCAQSFLPVSRGFLAGETIWNDKFAKKQPYVEWSNILEQKNLYLTMNKHRFLARGGEVLYLQLCNALRQSPEKIEAWTDENGLEFSSLEKNPVLLHEALERALTNLMDYCPRAVTQLSDFIDSGLEDETSRFTDATESEVTRFVTAGWCPIESWQEGYLFAVDLFRLCTANLDVIDRLYLIETACSMQVLRSLAMQSARYNQGEVFCDWPGYRIAVTNPEENIVAAKRISAHSAKKIEKMIFRAIRSGEALDHLQNDKPQEKILKEADTRYGGKHFIGLSKKIGFIIPKRGASARFVLNEQLLRFLVLTIVPAGKRITYDTFKKLVEKRHGLVFDATGFSEVNEWLEGSGIHFSSNIDSWVQEMLKAAGLLVYLSDSCALVENPDNVNCMGVE